MNDRIAILEAIHHTSDLTAAAKRLRVSRRTLQNRMRALGMTRGKAGRRKRKLYTGKKAMWAAGGAVAAGLGLALLIKRGSDT